MALYASNTCKVSGKSLSRSVTAVLVSIISWEMSSLTNEGWTSLLITPNKLNRVSSCCFPKSPLKHQAATLYMINWKTNKAKCVNNFFFYQVKKYNVICIYVQHTSINNISYYFQIWLLKLICFMDQNMTLPILVFYLDICLKLIIEANTGTPSSVSCKLTQ